MSTFLIASDLHGSAKYVRLLMERFEKVGAERMLLLGDLLYHGPRNGLPEEYDPKEVIRLLETVQNRVLCVRGNCDAEVDQMVLPFPILADYAVLPVGDRLLYMTHGHQHNQQTPPPLQPGDLLLCGHTHVPKCEDCGTFTYLNPGSVSLPKEDSRHSYMTLTDGQFQWKDLLTGETYREFRV